MSDTEDNRNKQTTRRDFIVLTASSVAAVGAACAFWPIIDSLNPSTDVLALSSIEVDLSSIAIGQTVTVKWQGKPIFITNRTPDGIASARAVKMSELIDPEKDEVRVKAGHDNWLVTIGICTHLGCVPLSNQGEYNGWFCPCHGSQYDSSGRVRKGPASLNLVVPPYIFISDTKIRIG
ncbi:ubiquinol-cytochrome c reductase iron-sulfur subunit [Rickettsia typhi]|uniref:Ubiquinol-cytochrome c reductase iron-sulfur subunit n=2 Tax=Rickettsia typhi TaxID=785 RepID=UCRI_RICTY|nr:ubiquinol-cytochrome c reductase iron-sulfur subunit [Rickettsia typhi]Q68XA0.1 RecName: Full=Ubiquinol-cytochrome c reductase iron-sulfur subunit; AltName: Full=Rieske iron-sulfur protein; Short=RISP [Rickettsia typhi str. Wilmington]AAU03742.1 Complex III (mitochondrial electron transport) [Rickettsia typhi str. Wilmington]AFE54119.1 Ubiquinol-cytochrome c reductase iron-sulfur subunit [Rickettsia typhi str. TH1527]AFE54958.1 Ubiquinol-cytochrome c reductase iron-sulfur subunit [Rickettsia